MQQRLSEFFDTLPENKRFMEDMFISLPARFGDVMGDSFLRAGMDAKGLFAEMKQQVNDMIRSIVAEIIRQLVTRAATKLMIGMLGRPEMDPETGEATGKITGGWDWLRNFGSFLSGAFGGAPKRAMGGPVEAGRLYQVNEHRREFFRPNIGGQVIPLGPQPQAPSISRVYLVDDERAAFERGATRREIVRTGKQMRKVGRLVPGFA
jgi:hypothetical protein